MHEIPDRPPAEALPGAGLALESLAAPLLVRGGEVSLFLQDAAGGRQYLGGLGRGALLRPVPPTMTGFSLVAVPGPEAVLGPAGALDAAGVAAWIEALAGRLPVEFPRDTRRRAPSLARLQLQAGAGELLLAHAGTIWLDLGEAGGMLFGHEAVGGLVPLPPHGWLTCTTAAPVTVLDTATAWQRPQAAAALQAFELACLELLASAGMLARADRFNRAAMAEALAVEGAAALHRRARRMVGVGSAEAVGDGADDPHGLFAVAGLVAGARPDGLTRPARLRQVDLDRPLTLEEIAAASDLRLHAVTLAPGWWRRDAGPLVGALADGTPVALLRSWRGYRASNPVTGLDVRVDATYAAGIAGRATALLQPLPPRRLRFTELLGVGLRQPWRHVLALLALAVASALLAQAVPIATRFAFNTAIPGRLGSALVEIGLGIALVALVSFLTTVASEVGKARMEAWATAGAFAGLWDRLIRLPLSAFARSPVADLAMRAAAANGSAGGLRQGSLAAATALGLALSSIGYMAAVHWPLAAFATLLLLIEVGLGLLSGWLQIRAFSTGEQMAGLADNAVLQFVSGITKLRLAGAEERALQRWGDRFLALRDRLTRARRIVVMHESLVAALAVLWAAGFYAVIMLVAGAAPGGTPLPLSDILALLAAFGIMTGAAGQLSQLAVTLLFLVPTVRYAGLLLQAPPEPSAGLANPGQLVGAIELNALSFRYGPALPPVLSGLSMRIEPGEFIGVVGRSGAGKSTLAKLLLGLVQPVAGSIQIDGHDLRTLDPGPLRRQIGVVLQNGRIMPGSILDAVRGHSGADEAAVWAGLQAASMAAEVRAMPMGLHTLLTDANQLVSGGQVQRLLLARALIQRPAVLILDEATSALDDATQAAAMQAIVALPATRIVIAHRLSTLRHADRILSIGEGGLCRIVTFDSLAGMAEDPPHPP